MKKIENCPGRAAPPRPGMQKGRARGENAVEMEAGAKAQPSAARMARISSPRKWKGTKAEIRLETFSV